MRTVLIMATTGMLASAAQAAVQTKAVTYQHEGVTLKGHLCWDDAVTGKRPGVIVVHEFWGLNDYAKKRAEMLAQLGYAAMAVDMYGDGKATSHSKEASEMAGTVRANLKTWQGRAQAGMKLLQAQPMVDPTKIAAIGYCFGGSTALQLAMSGADVAAVVSFHGALPAITADQAKAIKAKILICHGAEDTFITEKDCEAFRSALSKAKVDYQFHYFGGVKHSFTVPHAEDAGVAGLQYDAAADRRSWQMMLDLFKEAFGK
jgi:dienelactone hydrolase